MAEKKMQLVDQFGRPIERSVLSQEIAGPTITGVRSPITGYPGDGLNPGRLASILREADQGDPLRFLELAETIEERDAHYAGVLGTRKRSVAQLPVFVDAADDTPEAVKHADMIRDWLKRDELQDELFDILDAIGKGYSVTEIVWDTSAKQYMPRLHARDARHFRPRRDDLTTPMLITDAGDRELPPFKFVFARIRAKSGLPVRSGVARVAAWMWMFKAYTQRDWAIFTQTFGQPIRVGKYPAGASEADKDTLFRAVANIAGDCAAIVPESMLIEFVESKNVTAGTDLYIKRADWLDQQVSKLVLGQTATTDAIAGGHAVGQEHRQVQKDIERADARAIAAVLNRDLVRPWIDLEYGAQEIYPRIRIGLEDDRDVKQTIDGINTLLPAGLEVEEAWVRDVLGIPDPKPGAKLLKAAQPAPNPFGLPGSPLTPARKEALLAALANEARRDPFEVPAADADALAAAAQDEMLDAIRAAIAGAATLEQAQAALARLDVPKEKLALVMRQVLVLAELMGRAEIAAWAKQQS
ncbi:MAG: DUF935 domain-containing protein [Xanthobacteraceae bacterium]